MNFFFLASNVQNSINIHWSSLLISGSLVLIALIIESTQKLGMVKETIVAVLRAIIQLIIVGYLLTFIFKVDSIYLTISAYFIIILNASWNVSKRAVSITRGKSFLISFIALFTAVTITIGTLIISGTIKTIPSQVIPITGMIASNAMTSVGLVYRQLGESFRDKRGQILGKLSLGAGIHMASKDIFKSALRTGMQPQIDTAKTLGLVSLPGMMSGLIFAGVSPVSAIKYQIMVVFMLLAATSLASIISNSLLINNYFNKEKQLIFKY